MTSDHNPRSAACLAGFLRFRQGLSSPFSGDDPIADSRIVRSIGRGVPRAARCARHLHLLICQGHGHSAKSPFVERVSQPSIQLWT
jgi:hypothetical protein